MKQAIGKHVQAYLWASIASLYTGLVYSIVKHGHAPDYGWLEFQNKLSFWLGWIDLTSASAIRYRAIHQETLIPPDTTDLVTISHINPWYLDHRMRSMKLLEARATAIRQIEEYTLNRSARKIWNLANSEDTKDNFVPAYRLERRRREAISSTHNTAEQIQLAEPYIGDHFPIVGYYTRQDRRVRPCHIPMNGFLAVRSWPHWNICVPPCSWNCRCYLRYYARFECITKGWMTKDGNPKFDVKWPNSLAKANFESGRFPEWKNPKPWAG